MWDFEHPPLDAALARRYRIDRMAPSECAARLSDGTAELGLIPIAALAFAPQLRILPGCTIASKARVRSLILVRRASQPLGEIRSVAADTASRTTIAYTRTLFHKWGNPAAVFVPLAADLDCMLKQADAAVVIGDPALLALEERANRFARTGEELVYHDIAQEWISLTGLPYISAVWAASPACPLDDGIANDFIQSRMHGCQNVETLVAEWSRRLPMPAETIRAYLTTNIHYTLDQDCIEGMRGFFRMAAEAGVLPEAKVMLPEPVV
jgi:chorismate dehydratase